MTRVTTKELLSRIEKHESECNIKYDHIKQRLDEGSKKFIRSEYYIWGIYGAIFITFFADKFV